MEYNQNLIERVRKQIEGSDPRTPSNLLGTRPASYIASSCVAAICVRLMKEKKRYMWVLYSAPRNKICINGLAPRLMGRTVRAFTVMKGICREELLHVKTPERIVLRGCSMRAESMMVEPGAPAVEPFEFSYTLAKS